MTNVQSWRYIWIRKQNIMMAFKSVHQQTSYTCHIPHIEEVKVKPSPSHEGARVWYTYMYLISSFRGAKLFRVTDPPPTPGMDTCPSQYSQRIPVPSFSWVDWDNVEKVPCLSAQYTTVTSSSHRRVWTYNLMVSGLTPMTTEPCAP